MSSLTLAALESQYPPREGGGAVTRFAPSPTGFVHIGSLLPILVGKILVEQSGGTTILRLEDTDQKREIPGAAENIVTELAAFGITFDEGYAPGGDVGAYGPYRQRARAELYQTAARVLVERGLAYPCFCTEDTLSALRERQTAAKITPGYYGTYAACRNLSPEDAKSKMDAGLPYVLRLKAPETAPDIVLDDPARGRMTFPANEMDAVLLKQDGIPTYHFAHVCDDHLMRVTHVVRGDEWLAAYPLHHMLFDLLGWERPTYIHLAPLQKNDGASKRKLSKRKDPEAALSYYAEAGFAPDAVWEYIYTLLNSNYEEWRAKNPTAPRDAFPFSLKKLPRAGALFDLPKLGDISKNHIASLTAEEMYAQAADWAARFAPDFHALLTRDKSYSLAVLSLGRGGKKVRKDIATWADLPELYSYFYDFSPVPISDEQRRLCAAYAPLFDPVDTAEKWFGTLKTFAAAEGYCPDMKQYKQSPEGYKGSVADVSAALRLGLTGRENTPDLREIMCILGRDEVLRRLTAMDR